MKLINKLNIKCITGPRRFFCVVGLYVILMLWPSSGWGEPGGDRETIIKAGFVYNFSKFVNWPEEGDGSDNTPYFNLCVMGQNAIEDILSRLGENRKIKSKKVKIMNNMGLDDLENCQILYINDSEQHLIGQIVEATRGKSVLTISSGRKAAKMGVAISFVVVGNKMRFVVNKKTIEQNQLTVSSELLDLAIRVHQ